VIAALSAPVSATCDAWSYLMQLCENVGDTTGQIHDVTDVTTIVTVLASYKEA